MRPDNEENKKLYGKEISNKEILEQGVPTPAAARILTSELNRSSMTGGERADRPAKD
jgi:lipid-binding SYLF domain-containing protein